MDRDNTIARLENIAKHAVHTAGEDTFILSLDDGLAIHEAIEALKAQLSHEGAPSDLISRQAVINAIENTNAKMSMPEWDEITNAVMSLPPAQPKPHEGHWIPHESPDGGEQYECSRCGVLWEFNDGTPEDNEAYFCPKCGKKLITK